MGTDNVGTEKIFDEDKELSDSFKQEKTAEGYAFFRIQNEKKNKTVWSDILR